MFGGSPEYGQITKTFQFNKTKNDFFEWFKNNSAWKNLDPVILNAIIQTLYENPKFEVFVHVSMMANLIKEYKTTGKDLSNFEEYIKPTIIISRIVKILSKTTASCVKRVSEILANGHLLKREREFRKYHLIGIDTAESTIIIQPSFLPGYIQLGFLYRLISKNELSRNICNLGLAQVDELRKSPMMDSKVLNLNEDLNESEKALLEILEMIKE